MLRVIAVVLWMAAASVGAAELPVRLPGEWLADQQLVWQANGVTVEWVLPDVLTATWPNGSHRLYLAPMTGAEPLTRADWVKQAVAGEWFPPPSRPLRRLAFGAMLYDSYPRNLAKSSGRPWTEEWREIFATMRTLGIDSVVTGTYMTVEEWPGVEAAAEAHDVDLVLQYHHAYFRPDRGRAYYDRHSLPKALALARAVSVSPRLLGFAIREEVGYEDVPWMQEFHWRLLQACPGLPIYCLYNSVEALAGTPPPGPAIVGHDQYPFLGGYYGGGRQRPSFLTPQRALRHQLLGRLRGYRDGAMRLGAVFTFTPDMQPGLWVRTDDEMREQNIPLVEYPGVIRLDNGRWLLWRRYQAPPNATRAAVWIAAACGAQGWFPWYYTPKMPEAPPIPEAPTEPYRADSSRDGAENSPIWQEYARTIAELRPLEPWLLRLRPDGFPRFASDDPLLAGEVLRPLAGGGHAVILVNCDVGRWNGYPEIDWKNPNLQVDRAGRLTGYIPLAEPREVEFRLRLGPGETVRRLPLGETLAAEPAGDGSWHALRTTIDPGGGVLLFIGTPAQQDSFVSSPNPR